MLTYVIGKTNMDSPISVQPFLTINLCLVKNKAEKEVIIFRRNVRDRGDGNADGLLTSSYRAIL